MVDIVVGMYTYTYPKIDTGAVVNVKRPSGFLVYEIVNEVDLGTLDLEKAVISKKCGDVFIYIVEKIGLDTITVGEIAKKLMKCSSAEFLGLKDANALVRQIMVFQGCKNPQSVLEYCVSDNKCFRAVLWQCDSAVIHKGNRFVVKLASENGSLEVIKKRLQYMEKYGFAFLNFFGYQRFGLHRVYTHIAGKLLVKKNWGRLVDLLCSLGLAHRPGTPEHLVCELRYRYEDELKIVKKIPKQYLLLYINAYQSYIFNVLLSKLWLSLVSLHSLEEALKILKTKYPYLPIVGSTLHTQEPFIAGIVDEILEAEGISLKDFSISELALDVKGDMRKSFEHVHNLSTNLGEEGLSLEFVLSRGCYATVFLREVLRCDPTAYV